MMSELSSKRCLALSSEFEMRGVVARRRVAFSENINDRPSARCGCFLLPLRAGIAAWAGVQPEAFMRCF